MTSLRDTMTERPSGGCSARGPRLGPAPLALLSLCLLLPGCSRGSGHSGSGRGVLVIAIDALRYDHIGSNGYDRATTPTLDLLAAAGASFTQVYSTAPWNLPACASLLTGCDPYLARRILPRGVPSTLATRWNIPRDAPRLAQQFLLSGWSTVAFVDDPTLAPVHGFAAGFQVFQRPSGAGDDGGGAAGLAAIGGRFEQWLRSRASDEDWFAFLHVHDLERTWRRRDPRWDTVFDARPELQAVPPVGEADHLYFAIPRERWSGGVTSLGEYQARYDGALLRIDQELGRLFSRMAHLGRLSNTTVCVVGTHGLGFGEAGLILDHGALSEVDLHVPLILRPAVESELALGRRIDALASLVDVAPTLLELAGVGSPGAMHGTSLVPLLAARSSVAHDYVVARAGFQDGYAVLDSRWSLELTEPWRVDEEVLAESWYGHLPPYDERTRVVLRDRSGLQAGNEERAAALQRLCEHGARWIRDVERLRRGLQTVDWVISAGLDVEPDVRVLGPCSGEAVPGDSAGR